MSNIWYLIAVIALITVITVLTRALPFLVFGKRPLPKVVQYLADALPPAIMIILVVYCLKSTDFLHAPYGLAEMLSVALVAGLQFWRKNMYLSIVAGTVCYMILIRVM